MYRFDDYFYKYLVDYKDLIDITDINILSLHLEERCRIINEQEMPKSTWAYYRNQFDTEQKKLNVNVFKFYVSINNLIIPKIKMEIIYPENGFQRKVEFLTILLILELYWGGKFFPNLLSVPEPRKVLLWENPIETYNDMPTNIDMNVLKNVIYEILNIAKICKINLNEFNFMKNGDLLPFDFTLNQYYYIYIKLFNKVPHSPKLEDILAHPIYL